MIIRTGVEEQRGPPFLSSFTFWMLLNLPEPTCPLPGSLALRGCQPLLQLPSPVAGVSLEGISALCTLYSLTQSHLDVLRARTVLYSSVVPALTPGAAHRGALQFTRSFHRESLARLCAVNWKHGPAWWETDTQTDWPWGKGRGSWEPSEDSSP